MLVCRLGSQYPLLVASDLQPTKLRLDPVRQVA